MVWKMNKLINILHPIYQSTRTSVEATRIVNPCNLKTKYMNTQSTIDKMRQLRLNGMSDLYQRAIKERGQLNILGIRQII